MLPSVTKEQLMAIRYNLSGKVVIITGGTAGIGHMTAEYLLAQGCKVTITGTRKTAPEIAAQLCPDGNCLGLSGDVCDAAFRKEVVEKTIAAFGRIDALVNSAGINILELAEDVQEEHWNKIVATDLTASFFMAQEVGKYMIAGKTTGSIVNITRGVKWK